MELISLEDAKTYLRVDSSDEDALIGMLLSTAQRLCADVGRLDEKQWAVVSSENGIDDAVDTVKMYTDAELSRIREVMKAAILYALGYLYEHREEADHHDLIMTLRSILFAVREGIF